MADENVREAGNKVAGNEASVFSSEDAFQLMAQGLAQMQVANGRLKHALCQQEQNISQTLQQQEKKSHEAAQEATRQQVRKMEENINQVRQGMKGKITRVSEAVCNLTLAVNEGLQRVGERLESLESKVSSLEKERAANTRGQDGLEQLESRMKNLEVSVQKALQSVFPRVDALVSQLQNRDAAITSQNSGSNDIPVSGVTSASGSSCPPCHPSSSATPSSVPECASAQLLGEQGQCVDIGRDLCKAVEDGNVEEVQRLLNLGASANFSDSDGWTPLHWAARNAHTEIVALLLDQRADVHARDTDGDTPLHLAALYDRVGQCIFLLIDAGAPVDSRDKNGETPLGWAANAGNIAAVKLLKAAKCRESPEETDD